MMLVKEMRKLCSVCHLATNISVN